MALFLEYGIFSLNLLILILHCIGSYLQITLYKNGYDCVQFFYLINLSVLETIKNMIGALQLPITDMYQIHGQTRQIIITVQRHLFYAGEVINITYYLVIIYITVDKLLEIKLNIRHPVFWDLKKAKYLLCVTWGLSVAAFISLSVTQKILNRRLLFELYIYVVFDVFFLLLATYTYGYIFRKYCKAKTIISRFVMIGCTLLPNAGERVCRPSLYKVFKKSSFYVSCLLIINFFLLRLVPNLLHYAKPLFIDHNSAYRVTTELPIKLSNLFEVYIYIFMQKSVQRLFKKKFCRSLFKKNAVGQDPTSIRTN